MVKRYKQAEKILTFYKHNFKVISPYSVVVDGTFCMAAKSFKINIREQLPKYLGEEANVLITKCVLHELETIGAPVYAALAIARQFEIAPCPHGDPRQPADCLAHLARRAGNGHEKYIFASQDDDVKKRLRAIVGTPIIFIKYNTILFDRISEATKASVDPAKDEVAQLKELKTQVLGEVVLKKKKKKKGVNPLSCKKKIVKEARLNVAEKTANGKRRRRKAKKVDEA